MIKWPKYNKVNEAKKCEGCGKPLTEQSSVTVTKDGRVICADCDREEIDKDNL